MRTTLRDPTARLLDLLSDRLKRRALSLVPGAPKGFTLHSDRGRGMFLRNRTAGDRSVLSN